MSFIAPVDCDKYFVLTYKLSILIIFQVATHHMETKSGTNCPFTVFRNPEHALNKSGYKSTIDFVLI